MPGDSLRGSSSGSSQAWRAFTRSALCLWFVAFCVKPLQDMVRRRELMLRLLFITACTSLLACSLLLLCTLDVEMGLNTSATFEVGPHQKALLARFISV